MIINITHYIRLYSDSKFFDIRELTWRPHAVDIRSYDQYIDAYLHEYHTNSLQFTRIALREYNKYKYNK
jgi:hypothetical protein